MTVALLAGLVAAAAWWVLTQRSGVPIGEAERVRLLERSGLPSDFPVYPGARRMAQPRQGGWSYSVNVAVPDVTVWLKDSLERSGYDVETWDLEGDNDFEFQPRWLYYYRRVAGVSSSGAIIVRQMGSGAYAPTEVKVLSQQDTRLKPPPLPGDAALPRTP